MRYCDGLWDAWKEEAARVEGTGGNRSRIPDPDEVIERAAAVRDSWSKTERKYRRALAMGMGPKGLEESRAWKLPTLRTPDEEC